MGSIAGPVVISSVAVVVVVAVMWLVYAIVGGG